MTPSAPNPACSQVTTLALLIRKKGLSASLFTRYWRDVHGMLAARIPGFASYRQFHLGQPLQDVFPVLDNISTTVDRKARFDGLAEVLFNHADDRSGLATSHVAALIQQDEQNVFRTSLLFNLDSGASTTRRDMGVANEATQTIFLLLGRHPVQSSAAVINAVDHVLVPQLLQHPGLLTLRTHFLMSGDPQSWNTASVDNTPTPETAFDAILELVLPDAPDAVRLALAGIPASLSQVIARMQAYPVRANYLMVDQGRPTHLGLRGFDVLHTIDATGAANQRSDAVLDCIYGTAITQMPHRPVAA